MTKPTRHQIEILGLMKNGYELIYKRSPLSKRVEIINYALAKQVKTKSRTFDVLVKRKLIEFKRMVPGCRQHKIYTLTAEGMKAVEKYSLT